MMYRLNVAELQARFDRAVFAVAAARTESWRVPEEIENSNLFPLNLHQSLDLHQMGGWLTQ